MPPVSASATSSSSTVVPSRFAAIRGNARRLERRLRLTTPAGVALQYDTETIDEWAEGADVCENGLLIERVAEHRYKVHATTIDDDGYIMTYAYLRVDEHGTLCQPYRDNVLSLDSCEPCAQVDADGFFAELADNIAGRADYWDVVEREP